jgi:hypothetical protein
MSFAGARRRFCWEANAPNAPNRWRITWPRWTRQRGPSSSGQVAIDDVWSALRFRADKPGEEPFKGGAK